MDANNTMAFVEIVIQEYITSSSLIKQGNSFVHLMISCKNKLFPTMKSVAFCIFYVWDENNLDFSLFAFNFFLEIKVTKKWLIEKRREIERKA